MAKSTIDPRVVRTRKLLHQALFSLILKKGYDAVTIEEICEAASVGRSTFYGHYKSKDDLKRSGLQNLRKLLADRLREREEIAGDQRLSFSLTMFEHARDHLHLYRALAGSRGGALALGVIRQLLSDLVREELALATKDSTNSVESDIAVQFAVGAYMTVLIWWLDGGARLPPRRVDEIFRRLAINGMIPRPS